MRVQPQDRRSYNTAIVREGIWFANQREYERWQREVAQYQRAAEDTELVEMTDHLPAL